MKVIVINDDDVTADAEIMVSTRHGSKSIRIGQETELYERVHSVLDAIYAAESER